MDQTSITAAGAIDTFLVLLIGIGPKIALVPFVEITASLDRSVKQRVLRTMMTTAATVAVLLMVLGELLRILLHFTIGSLSIAGGVILLVLAVWMVLAPPARGSSEHGAGKDPMQLAVFPLTTRDVRQPAAPCETCALKTCDFRRPTYVTSTKALAKWARERLVVKRAGDGSIQARFRFDGTTCSNMGRPLAFDYEVTLGPAAMDYPILAQQCTPADSGHTSMCGYTEGLMQAIAAEKPLAGRPVGEVLDWKRPVCSTGCYCDAAARDHKWGMVLETIHYALARLPK